MWVENSSSKLIHNLIAKLKTKIIKRKISWIIQITSIKLIGKEPSVVAADNIKVDICKSFVINIRFDGRDEKRGGTISWVERLSWCVDNWEGKKRQSNEIDTNLKWYAQDRY